MGGGLLQLIGFFKNHSQLGPKSTRQYCISSKARGGGGMMLQMPGGGGCVTWEVARWWWWLCYMGGGPRGSHGRLLYWI